MELGQHLVRELGFEDGVDTLGRWMAHHLAELLDQAQNERTSAGRAKARKEARETILRLWDHRTSIPGKAYPLAPYGDILAVLARLRPDANPFRYLRLNQSTDELAADLFDSLCRLIIALLLMKMPSRAPSEKRNDVAINALNNDEKKILVAIHQWDEIFHSHDTENSQTRNRSKRASTKEINLKEAAVHLIDTIATDLVALRTTLEENTDHKTD